VNWYKPIPRAPSDLTMFLIGYFEPTWIHLKSNIYIYSNIIGIEMLNNIYFSIEFSFIRPSDRRGIELARYRNMRSKRRCSLCLQFALLLGAGPVLHRPTSLVIHRLEWNHVDSLFLFSLLAKISFKFHWYILFDVRAVTRVIHILNTLNQMAYFRSADSL
jgi:hypothetical protein